MTTIASIIGTILARLLPGAEPPPHMLLCRRCEGDIEPGRQVGMPPLCVVCAENEGRGER